MTTQSHAVPDFNSALDYERAVNALKRRAGSLYRQYQGAKHDPAQTDESRQQILRQYGDTIEATKTLRPDDTDTIRTILSSNV